MKDILTSCNRLFSINESSSLNFCHAFQLGKNHRLHFHESVTRSLQPIELIHTDLWGPSLLDSNKGCKYYIIFVDDCKRYTWFFPLKAKLESLNAFKMFKTNAENQLNYKIKAVQSDWGGEFWPFSSFLAEHGTHFRHPCPHTHHQNSIVERKHRHKIESGLTLLAQAKMPLSFWEGAFAIAIHNLNRLPTLVLSHLSPFETLFKIKHDYHSMKPFGCSCFPFLRPYHQNKFNFHSSKYVFIGYSNH